MEETLHSQGYLRVILTGVAAKEVGNAVLRALTVSTLLEGATGGG